jgi:hypothetical protein
MMAWTQKGATKHRAAEGYSADLGSHGRHVRVWKRLDARTRQDADPVLGPGLIADECWLYPRSRASGGVLRKEKHIACEVLEDAFMIVAHPVYAGAH